MQRNLKKRMAFVMAALLIGQIPLSYAAPDIQAYIHQLQACNVLNSTSQVQLIASTGQILIFISASMSKVSLQQWFNQAEQIHAPLIIRGFIHHSLPDTKHWVIGLMEHNNKRGEIQINPIAFERYGIQQVPAVVVTHGTQCIGENCVMAPFDIVYGNVSLASALNVLANDGDVANDVAKNALIQLRAVND